MTSATDWMDRRARRPQQRWSRDEFGGWSPGRVLPGAGFPDGDRWSWAQGWPARFSDENQQLVGVRLRRLRGLVAARQLRLRAALDALDEFDRGLVEALDRLGLGDRDEESDEPSPDSGADLTTSQRTTLYRLFDVLVREEDRDNWTTTAAGLRVPDAIRIADRLAEARLAALPQSALTGAYIAFLNGDEPVSDGREGMAE